MPSLKQITKFKKNVNKSSIYKNRGEVLKTFYKLSLKKSLFSNNKPGTEKLMNRAFSYLDYSTLYILFDEIFGGLDYYFKTDKREPCIIDCGSNVGMSLFFFSYMYPAAKITGFEPDDLAFEMLKKNTADQKNVSVFKKAVTDHDGTIDFFTDPENAGSLQMSLYESRESEKKITVECISLSDFIDSPVDFLKMDIEGAELTVFIDLDKKKKLQYIEQMVIEYHHHIDIDEDKLAVMLGILESNGYGYQIRAENDVPFNKKVMQDVIIYAYKK
ncbi:MAG: hypothetical protein BMS9Abin31_0399 [Gammaproteobacteria bacterium]|nr:MAG: hypothetical protein BMS9Abin31_0399 [Gammaproteobacteria bacterium]